ncbi:hypothetical protein RRG08_037191 [Elysia crispata]|uniref:Uncharacterized protein n=1 Tax=Elysia crispata TaxID=231223 RepID=A0AAE0Z3A5_9GAST|nr:hypothetical protein RRG08_037191 [Elysia crispata]
MKCFRFVINVGIDINPSIIDNIINSIVLSSNDNVSIVLSSNDNISIVLSSNDNVSIVLSMPISASISRAEVEVLPRLFRRQLDLGRLVLAR